MNAYTKKCPSCEAETPIYYTMVWNAPDKGWSFGTMGVEDFLPSHAEDPGGIVKELLDRKIEETISVLASSAEIPNDEKIHKHIELVNTYVYGIHPGFGVHGCARCVDDFLQTWVNSVCQSYRQGRKFYKALRKQGTIKEVPPITARDVAGATGRIMLKGSWTTAKVVARVGLCMGAVGVGSLLGVIKLPEAIGEHLDSLSGSTPRPRSPGTGYDYRKHYGVGHHHGH